MEYKTLQCANFPCENTFSVPAYRTNKKFCSAKCRKRFNNRVRYAGKKAPPSSSVSTPPPPSPPAPDAKLLGHTAEELLKALVEELEPLCEKLRFGSVECWRYMGAGSRRREGLWRFSARDEGKEVQVNLAGGGKGARRKKVAIGRALLTLQGYFPFEYLVGGGAIGYSNTQYSHLCHHPWCCNPAHGIAETDAGNKSRYPCNSGMNKTCPHSPKCLLLGEKLKGVDLAPAHWQVISQDLE